MSANAELIYNAQRMKYELSMVDDKGEHSVKEFTPQEWSVLTMYVDRAMRNEIDNLQRKVLRLQTLETGR